MVRGQAVLEAAGGTPQPAAALLAKRDIAWAFRLLWVAPLDVSLFAGNIPFDTRLFLKAGTPPPEALVASTFVGTPAAVHRAWDGGDGVGILREGPTCLPLVLYFSWCGCSRDLMACASASVAGHQAFQPRQPAREGPKALRSTMLMDDAILVEPELGLRPGTSAATYGHGARTLWEPMALSLEKKAAEGESARSRQCGEWARVRRPFRRPCPCIGETPAPACGQHPRSIRAAITYT